MDAAAPRFQSALSTTLVLLRAGQTRLTSVSLFNPGAATAYIQCFDAAAATGGAAPTLGTTAPSAVFAVPAGASVQLETNLGFLAGLVVACTATATGSGAPNAGNVCTFGIRNGADD